MYQRRDHLFRKASGEVHIAKHFFIDLIRSQNKKLWKQKTMYKKAGGCVEFKTLIVYQKAKIVYEIINDKILPKLTDRTIKDQLKRSSLSIVLNIAEGTSRTSKADRRHFFVIARGSTYETYAIIDLLKIESEFTQSSLVLLEEISKMLYSLIKGLSKTEIK